MYSGMNGPSGYKDYMRHKGEGTTLAAAHVAGAVALMFEEGANVSAGFSLPHPIYHHSKVVGSCWAFHKAES